MGRFHIAEGKILSFHPERGTVQDPAWARIEGVCRAHLNHNWRAGVLALKRHDSEGLNDLIADLMLHMKEKWIHYPSTQKRLAEDAEAQALEWERSFVSVGIWYGRLKAAEMLRSRAYNMTDREQRAWQKRESNNTPTNTTLKVRTAEGKIKQEQGAVVRGGMKVYDMNTGELLRTEKSVGAYSSEDNNTLANMIVFGSSDEEAYSAVDPRLRSVSRHMQQQRTAPSAEDEYLQADEQELAHDLIDQLTDAEKERWATEFLKGTPSAKAASLTDPPISRQSWERRRNTGIKRLRELALWGDSEYRATKN